MACCERCELKKAKRLASSYVNANPSRTLSGVFDYLKHSMTSAAFVVRHNAIYIGSHAVYVHAVVGGD